MKSEYWVNFLWASDSVGERNIHREKNLLPNIFINLCQKQSFVSPFFIASLHRFSDSLSKFSARLLFFQTYDKLKIAQNVVFRARTTKCLSKSEIKGVKRCILICCCWYWYWMCEFHVNLIDIFQVICIFFRRKLLNIDTGIRKKFSSRFSFGCENCACNDEFEVLFH